MMEFTKNDWYQRDIINKIIISTKQDTITIHVIIPKKYQKYPSTTILKNANVLAKVNKLPYEFLHNMTSHDAYIITIHVLTITISDISHKQKE